MLQKAEKGGGEGDRNYMANIEHLDFKCYQLGKLNNKCDWYYEPFLITSLDDVNFSFISSLYMAPCTHDDQPLYVQSLYFSEMGEQVLHPAPLFVKVCGRLKDAVARRGKMHWYSYLDPYAFREYLQSRHTSLNTYSALFSTEIIPV